jgi:hypothetical protein
VNDDHDGMRPTGIGQEQLAVPARIVSVWMKSTLRDAMLSDARYGRPM